MEEPASFAQKCGKVSHIGGSFNRLHVQKFQPSTYAKIFALLEELKELFGHLIKETTRNT